MTAKSRRHSRYTSESAWIDTREGAMEVVTSPKCATPSDTDAACSTASIWQDVLAQAVTGELVAVLNYTSLAEICQSPDEVADALEHAESERGHATAFT